MRHLRRLFHLIFWLTFLSVARAERPNILILGDSLTAGYGLEPEQAYPVLLQKKIDAAHLDFNVINAGISGDTTADGLRRLPWLLKKRPAIFVVALGANDGLRGLPTDSIRKNLRDILQTVRQQFPTARLVIAGMKLPPNLGESYTSNFSEIFPSLAKSENASFIPFLLEGVAGRPDLNQADRIHPTARGDEILADTVWKTLQPLLLR